MLASSLSVWLLLPFHSSTFTGGKLFLCYQFPEKIKYVHIYHHETSAVKLAASVLLHNNRHPQYFALTPVCSVLLHLHTPTSLHTYSQIYVLMQSFHMELKRPSLTISHKLKENNMLTPRHYIGSATLKPTSTIRSSRLPPHNAKSAYLIFCTQKWSLTRGG